MNGVNKIMKKLFLIIVSLVSIISCTTIREVPIQTVEKVVYRDSVVYVKDSINVEIPVEVVKLIVLDVDTSYLKTSLAESIAYLDTAKRKLHHTLTQKGELTVIYDTIIKTQHIDRIMEKEVPVEVEVIKYRRDALFWVLAVWALLCVAIVFLKIYFKK
jgi:hypothetical protein